MTSLFDFNDADDQPLEATLSVVAETGSEKLATASGSQPTPCTPTPRAGAKRCQTPPASTNTKRQVTRRCGSGRLTPVEVRGAQTADCIFAQALRPNGEPAPSEPLAKRCARVATPEAVPLWPQSWWSTLKLDVVNMKLHNGFQCGKWISEFLKKEKQKTIG